ncbi:MAG: sulfotransferase domain-containing protein [Phycisphaerales bacterium]|nr:sulfotransferase domain-containing protein [Phycisphaerales bacterium]
MDQTDTQLTRLLRYAKEASPEGLRDVLRPVVRRVLPEHVRARLQDPPPPNPADRWFDNRYTILDRGTKRHFFFVCGCFKSGTHWVQNLLNLHPHAFVQGEYHFEVARWGMDHLTKVDWFLSSRPDLRAIGDDTFEMLVRRMIHAASCTVKPDAIWLGDRTPNELMTIIRGAPQIIITRDVRDVLISWSFHHVRVETATGMFPRFQELWKRSAAKFQEDPEGFNPCDGFLGDEKWVRHHAGHWAMVCRKSRAAIPKLREEGSEVLQLSYEHMHEDLAGETDRLYRFLGLDPRLAAAPSLESRTLPGFRREDRMSHYRRGEVGEWRHVLPEHVRGWIKEEAGEELIAAGYEKDLNW